MLEPDEVSAILRLNGVGWVANGLLESSVSADTVTRRLGRLNTIWTIAAPKWRSWSEELALGAPAAAPRQCRHDRRDRHDRRELAARKGIVIIVNGAIEAIEAHRQCTGQVRERDSRRLGRGRIVNR
ncbi:hypothetical protein IVB30_31870 [Bradyrhizobium sp. 200]|uniref:hypothetical protein n=1 Tax=Bradyrhizobium sp. 200 TaxID=2782665 RepID=UPI001FFF2E11|nr:hypothetical protein [Bradyrhizobium sp. 200]UPJ47787.1 hypothetical protein IVB30_31870 [Bradyrhizobium sp. 200]